MATITIVHLQSDRQIYAFYALMGDTSIDYYK